MKKMCKNPISKAFGNTFIYDVSTLIFYDEVLVKDTFEK